ncbi:Xaa-Pro dipeptidyl-peptidase [Lacticaseibacillus hegangensis]|uniref:Xaa-Pro dipeptidyl-peptidase n=1 Tax=Lacticaseibacillus hegangensis TaxID=2486010 RepID=A0ABW4CTX8_9LACO|nr:Xaa-Pro dipeptidyl-peptidase [Lacticaseibacillus hegangensis]
MKLNQNGRIQADQATQLKELQAIGFAPDLEQSLADAANAAFRKLFPEAFSETAKQQALAAIAVTDTQDLAQLLASKPSQISRTDFYAVALQLLGFEAGTDYQLKDSLAFMAETKLPVVASDITTTADFWAALYLLLCTRTKHLVTLIDALAARGFYRDFQRGKTTPEFLFFNGKAQDVFDARKVYREVVWVESDMDTDHDGKRDMLETTIFRPKETDQGVKMPVLFTANPYFHGTNDVDWITHKPDPKLAVKTHSYTKEEVTYQPATSAELPHQQVNGESKTAEVYSDQGGSYMFNDYMLGRGFVTVYSGGVGTRGSDGMRSTGGTSETDSAVAVIEWLTGKRRAFTNRTDGIEIKAWWCNGKVAMTGKSYLGTLSIAAATSGVEGLKTVISESAISSWYDYYRENGLVVAPGGFQGEDADVLAVDTFSRQKQAGDLLKIKAEWDKTLAAITKDQDREFGDYTKWWDERNYRNNLKNIKADVIIEHGLNDWNVKPANAIRYWNGIQDLPINKKLFLHQGQHTYLDNIRSLDFADQLNLWLSYELLDVDNGAPSALPNVTVQDNVTPETWHTYEEFGTADAKHEDKPYNLQADMASKRAGFPDNATAIFNEDKEDSDGFEAEIIKPDSKYNGARLWLDLPADTHDVTLEGVPHLKLRLWIDQPTAILSARLVDVGEAKRFAPVAGVVDPAGWDLGYDYKAVSIQEFKPAKETDSKLVSFGHVNVQNQQNAYENVPVKPGEPFTVDFDLQPTHLHLPAGRHLALIIHGADMAQTQRTETVVNFHIDLANSTLTLRYRK